MGSSLNKDNEFKFLAAKYRRGCLEDYQIISVIPHRYQYQWNLAALHGFDTSVATVKYKEMRADMLFEFSNNAVELSPILQLLYYASGDVLFDVFDEEIDANT